MIRLSHQGTGLILTIFLVGSLILPLVNHNCYLLLPTHGHIILGPVQPGWENHPHGEPISLAGRRQIDNYSHDDALRHPHTPIHISDDTDVLTPSKVISIAHPHTGHHSVFSYGGQSPLLADWLQPPDLARLNWPLGLTYVTSLGIFLPPPDKPPKASFYLTLSSIV